MILLAALLGGCTDEDRAAEGDTGPVHPPQGTVESLIDNHTWTLVEPAEDPWFPTDGNVPTECTEVDTGIEPFPDGDWWEIQTRKCAYATARTELQKDLWDDAVIRLRIWRYALKAAEGPFDLELAVGNPPVPIFEKEFPAPSFESELICQDIPIDTFYPKGTPIWWHLKNHGDNTWSMIEISARYCDPPCLSPCP